MIGIAFGYPDKFEQDHYGLPNVLRFARIEPSGDRYYWRKWEPEEGKTLAKRILEVVGEKGLTGFTLFWNGDKWEGKKPGYQLSVRRKGEEGWNISRISNEEAQKVFDLLDRTTDGPWTLTDLRDSFIVPYSQVERWPKALEGAKSAVDRGPTDLMSLLGAAEAAVRHRTAIQSGED